ncbi:MAG: CehA/McbA family metallohydrolase [Acidobacteria bacterium]|nr:CehA/McbA family metallohydrolase [Acidobacteriota bacterium]
MQRRSFLQATGAGVPTVRLLQTEAAGKFTPVPLEKLFTASARDFGPRPWARNEPGVTDNLIRPPAGGQRLRGLPFELAPEGVDGKCWAVVSNKGYPWTARTVEVPLEGTARFLCVAQFCDWEKAEFDPESPEEMEGIGAVLAEASLLYEDGAARTFPVRRRFEVNPPAAAWGRECFNAMQSNSWRSVGLEAPLEHGTDWGMQQQAVRYQAVSRTALWIWALENPRPEQRLKALRLDARGDELLALCGLTLFHGRENPLRHERRRLYRVTLPAGGDAGRWKVETDLGIVVRTFAGSEFLPEQWLRAGTAGLGERQQPKADARHLYVEIACSNEATLTLRNDESGARYDFDLSAPEKSGLRVEAAEQDKSWVHGRILDSASGRPVAARIAFRTRDGRYLPPYGHRAEVNTGWFQDYGADVQLGHSAFAYVDGTFQMELPAGEVYVEISKGFEYEAVRQRLVIQPGQRALDLRLDRLYDWRMRGWVTADTHVHFLSPSTALLEAQAEGLNLVNLLAAQWGDLYTNVGDLAHGHLVSRDAETLVAVGTENRQHLMGHLGLLGGHGAPVFPMSADGPSEAFTGDPMWTSMADWADACRKREGLVVAVHFPNPNAELAAEIVRGKVDALELYPRGDGTFRTLAYQEWYRYLNCGYRLAAAGGTDKMSAAVPVGGNRTYAFLGNAEFSFANWAAAVRAGRTFSTTGPLLDLRAENEMPGGEIQLRRGGGTIEVAVSAVSYVPFHRLEIVYNGKVIATREEPSGTRSLNWKETVRVPGTGWLAARCSSRMPAARFGVAAHTSPVYVVVPGEELFSGPAAAYFLKLIEGTQIYVENLAARPDRERLERIRQTLREAHERLHARLPPHRH